ncbi:hypothetical protein J6590_060615 [Homalodisca vitripennis]|nr:hypothetical protein J6590_060615 [Homalodisca vitripennis]
MYRKLKICTCFGWAMVGLKNPLSPAKVHDGAPGLLPGLYNPWFDSGNVGSTYNSPVPGSHIGEWVDKRIPRARNALTLDIGEQLLIFTLYLLEK